MTVFTARIVSTPSELREFLSSIPPHATLYLDLESAPLTRANATTIRDTTVSLLTILIHQLQEIFILDLLSLGYTAFTTLSDAGETLQSLLEDPGYTKYFWDARGAAGPLWHHYEVGLDGVVDIQLLENASRRTGRDKEFLATREVAIRNDLNPVVGIANVKRDRRPKSAWIPIQGGGGDDGSSEDSKGNDGRGGKTGDGIVVEVDEEDGGDVPAIFVRPLAEDTILTCTRGVLHLRGLRDVYMKRISIAWLGKVRQETTKRIEETHARDYQPQPAVEEDEEAKGPWKARIGTVGVMPMIVVRNSPSPPPYTPGYGPLKVRMGFEAEEIEEEQDGPARAEKKLSRFFGRPVPTFAPGHPLPDMSMHVPRDNKLERKKSKFLRWPHGSFNYPGFGRDSRENKVDVVEPVQGGWWD